MKYTSDEIPCCITGLTPVDLHHVKTRGAGGGDEPENLMPLIRSMHQEIHRIGLYRFAEKYPKARRWLTENGWEIDPVAFKWINSRLS